MFYRSICGNVQMAGFGCVRKQKTKNTQQKHQHQHASPSGRVCCIPSACVCQRHSLPSWDAASRAADAPRPIAGFPGDGGALVGAWRSCHPLHCLLVEVDGVMVVMQLNGCGVHHLPVYVPPVFGCLAPRNKLL